MNARHRRTRFLASDFLLAAENRLELRRARLVASLLLDPCRSTRLEVRTKPPSATATEHSPEISPAPDRATPARRRAGGGSFFPARRECSFCSSSDRIRPCNGWEVYNPPQLRQLHDFVVQKIRVRWSANATKGAAPPLRIWSPHAARPLPCPLLARVLRCPSPQPAHRAPSTFTDRLPPAPSLHLASFGLATPDGWVGGGPPSGAGEPRGMPCTRERERRASAHPVHAPARPFGPGSTRNPPPADTHLAPAGDLYASLVAADLRFSSGWPVGWLEHLLQPLPAVSAVGMLPTEPPSGSREPACNRRFDCVCNYYFSTLSVP